MNPVDGRRGRKKGRRLRGSFGEKFPRVEAGKGTAPGGRKKKRRRRRRSGWKLIQWKSLALSVDNSNFITGAKDYDLLETSSQSAEARLVKHERRGREKRTRGLAGRKLGNFKIGIANCS